MAHHPARILVVDDDPTIRSLLASVLALAGYAVTAAADGVAALAHVPTHWDAPPDLIITDVCMPELDGPGLVAALRAGGFGAIPVIAISSLPYPREVSDLQSPPFVQKPFDLDVLLDAVQAALAPRLVGTPVWSSAPTATPVSRPGRAA